MQKAGGRTGLLGALGWGSASAAGSGRLGLRWLSFKRSPRSWREMAS